MKVFNVFLLSIIFFPRVFSLLPPPKKICRDCIHYIGDNNDCRLFGDTNIVTGEVKYPPAELIRRDSEKCGEDASHFKKNKFKIITESYFFCKKNWMVLSSAGILYLYFKILIYKEHYHI
jgi:hypothetical protein